MISDRRGRFFWGSGAVAAVLWILCATAFGLFSWFSILPQQFLAHLLPETISAAVWHWPWPWVLLAPLASTLALFLSYLLLARLATGRPSGPALPRLPLFFALWFAAVASGVIATLPWAAGMIVASLPPSRAAAILDPAYNSLLLSGYWGVAWGWLPALFALRGLRRRIPGAGDTPDAARLRRRVTALLAGALVLAMAASGTAFALGTRAAKRATAAAGATANGHTIGALPDPYAGGSPPPSVAPGQHVIDPSWCGPAQTDLLLGDPNAATGHRQLPIRIMNFSDTSCVLQGYPDIAFADQNGAELTVKLVHGGSFMTQDAGPVKIVLPAGGYAITELGWGAMAPAGAKVAYALHAAAYPGLERGSWPVTLDIVKGGEVDVTAWQLDDGPAAE